MSIEIVTRRCPQNHACPAVYACPVDALTQTGYSAPILDSEECIECGRCVRTCPTGAIQQHATARA